MFKTMFDLILTFQPNPKLIQKTINLYTQTAIIKVFLQSLIYKLTARHFIMKKFGIKFGIFI